MGASQFAPRGTIFCASVRSDSPLEYSPFHHEVYWIPRATSVRVIGVMDDMGGSVASGWRVGNGLIVPGTTVPGGGVETRGWFCGAMAYGMVPGVRIGAFVATGVAVLIAVAVAALVAALFAVLVVAPVAVWSVVAVAVGVATTFAVRGVAVGCGVRIGASVAGASKRGGVGATGAVETAMTGPSAWRAGAGSGAAREMAPVIPTVSNATRNNRIVCTTR